MQNISLLAYNVTFQGRIQDFKLAGAHLKKLRRAEGGEKHFGVFRVKNHDLTPKNHIFSNFRGGGRRVRPPPPLDPPLNSAHLLQSVLIYINAYIQHSKIVLAYLVSIDKSFKTILLILS